MPKDGYTVEQAAALNEESRKDLIDYKAKLLEWEHGVSLVSDPTRPSTLPIAAGVEELEIAINDLRASSNNEEAEKVVAETLVLWSDFLYIDEQFERAALAAKTGIDLSVKHQLWGAAADGINVLAPICHQCGDYRTFRRLRRDGLRYLELAGKGEAAALLRGAIRRDRFAWVLAAKNCLVMFGIMALLFGLPVWLVWKLFQLLTT
ncbi:MAG: hypothetical protein WC314_16955 [Vulcanimicrobiota bacterium]